MKKLIDKTLFPVVNREEQGENFVYEELSCADSDMSYFTGIRATEIPYLKDVEEGVTKLMNASLEKLIIVSPSEPVAIKVAKYISVNEGLLLGRMKRTDIGNAVESGLEEDGEEDTEDPYGIFDEDFFESSDDSMKLCRFKACGAGGPLENMPGNLFLKMLASIEADGILYTGLSDASINKDKVEAILADERERKYVWITPDMVDEPWVVDLRMHKGFEIIDIKNIPKEYYANLLEEMLEKTRFRLDETLTSFMVVSNIMKKRGAEFAEEDMDWMIRYAIKRYRLRGGADNVLKEEDFALSEKVEKTPWDRLMKMPGLAEVKDMIEEYSALLCESSRNKELRDMHDSMIFYGNPGTGKTTCARLLAEIMADRGVSNASFTMATRADIIGEYVGHTSVKISKLFDKSRDGVLFVDEAGFFLNTNSGGYVSEAIKEFVRFMEMYPDVTVIFAMYEREASEFLKLDEGLASRISRMVEFEDFSDKEIQDIVLRIAEDNGYNVDKAAVCVAMEYLRELMGQKNFGNAREVRKLVESAIVAHSVRIGRGDRKKIDNLTRDDIKRGIERLRKTPKSRKSFGFKCSPEPGIACSTKVC